MTFLWGATFLVRVVVSWLLYEQNAVGWLGTASLLLGLPVTAVELVVTLGVVAALHRHRSAPPSTGAAEGAPA